jgi:DNA-binding transcriptional LysR family regulator
MNTADIDFNLLVALEALLAERNVTRAARRLGVTQPAMSNALRRLRVLLDDPVFVRTSEGMTPTARALAIGPAVADALNGIRAALSATGFDPQRSTARFTVATLDYLEALYFPRLIDKLAAAGPAIHLRVRRLPAIYELPQQQLESGAIDCAVGPFPQPMTPQSGLLSRVLIDEDWVCVGRRGHPAFRRRLTLKTYAGLRHLGISYPEPGGGSGMIDRLLAAHGLTRTCAAFVPHFLTLPFHVAQSDCVATLPRPLARLFARALPLQIVDAPLPKPSGISLVWHSRVDGDPAQRWLREMIVETCAAQTRRAG